MYVFARNQITAWKLIAKETINKVLNNYGFHIQLVCLIYCNVAVHISIIHFAMCLTNNLHICDDILL